MDNHPPILAFLYNESVVFAHSTFGDHDQGSTGSLARRPCQSDRSDMGGAPKMGVYTPKSCILMGFSSMNHPLRVPPFMEPPIILVK